MSDIASDYEDQMAEYERMAEYEGMAEEEMQEKTQPAQMTHQEKLARDSWLNISLAKAIETFS